MKEENPSGGNSMRVIEQTRGLNKPKKRERMYPMRYLPAIIASTITVGGCVYGIVSLEHGALIPITQAAAITACVGWAYLRGKPSKKASTEK